MCALPASGNRRLLFPFVCAVVVAAILAGVLLRSNAGRAAADTAPQVIATIPLGSTGSWGIDVDSGRDLIFVAGDNGVAVIDSASNTLLASVPVPTVPYNAPYDVAVNPNTGRVYVTATGAASVYVIEGPPFEVTGIIPVGRDLYDLAVNPETNRIYVADGDTGNLVVIDGMTDTVIGSAHVTSLWGPLGVAVNPFTNRIYANVFGDKTLAVVNGETNTKVGSISIGYPIFSGVAVNPTTNRVYVASYLGPLHVIDGQTNEILAMLMADYADLQGVAVNPLTNRVYVVGGGPAMVLDGETNAVLYYLAAVHGDWGVAVNPSNGRVYVAQGSEVVVLQDVLPPTPTPTATATARPTATFTPTPTPTRTRPPGVGGAVLLPPAAIASEAGGTSGGSRDTVLMWGALAVVAGVLATGGWYARGRRTR